MSVMWSSPSLQTIVISVSVIILIFYSINAVIYKDGMVFVYTIKSPRITSTRLYLGKEEVEEITDANVLLGLGN